MTEKTVVKPVKKKVKKKKTNFMYLYLFLFVFLSGFLIFSYIVKSFSPDVDVTIGNTETLTLSDSDMNLEVKPIDERLKWIQMEDDLPSVAIRDSQQKENVPLLGELLPNIQQDEIEAKYPDKKEPEKVIPSPPVPQMSDIKVAHPDFRRAVSSVAPSSSTKGPIPLPVKNTIMDAQKNVQNTSLTKVYLGSFQTIEEAMAIQQDISNRDSSIAPFIKAENDKYFVQLGSFSDNERANALVVKMRTIGYYPKITIIK